MVSRQQPGSGRWPERCWGLAVLLIVASLGPVVYCYGWGTPPGPEGMTFGHCVEVHPLQFPATIFVAGIMLALAGFVVRHQEDEARKETERNERRLEHKIAEAERDPVRTPIGQMGADAAGGDREEAPEAIEVDSEFDLDEADDDADEAPDRRDPGSAMAFLQQQQEIEERRRRGEDRRSGVDRDYYVPPGMEEAVELFVDADAQPTPVEDVSERLGASDKPYIEVDEALRDAMGLVMERGVEVVVRVHPGLYRASFEVPAGVSIVNHAIPVGATVDERLDWLRDQTEIDHPDRVTFLVPDEVETGIRVVSTEGQGLFGCHVVGRQGVAQTGLVVRDSGALAVVHCAFESFRDGAVDVVDSGGDLPGRRVQFIGCVWRGNSAIERGGALRVERSVMRLKASIFENNRAPRGGAIWASELDKPLEIERTLLRRNRSLGDDDSPAVDEMAPGRWRTEDGVGGAMWICDGLVKFVDTIVEGNDADLGGGGIAGLGARIVIESTGEGRGVVAENRAGAGGGVLAVGTVEQAAMVRLQDAEFEKNLGTMRAGGIGVVGNAVLQADGARLEANRADEGGVGGALGVWCGGAARCAGGEITDNDAAAGGAIAVRNGSLKLDELCSVDRNVARRGPGGGVLAVTSPDRRLEQLVGEAGFDLPFKLRIESARITANSADGPGGGLRAGNEGTRAAFPLVIRVEQPNWIDNNEAATERRHAQNTWIEWNGRMKVSDATAGSIELELK